MKNAVVYGAGNIGRGFIGQLLSESGYRVTFIDVNEQVVRLLKKEGRYPIRFFGKEGATERWVENVTAVDGNDSESVACAIAGADLMATAVGVHALQYIAKSIALGLTKRWEKGNGAPLDILICENLADAGRYLYDLVAAHLDGPRRDRLSASVGFVQTSVGRMVPTQTEKMQDGNPLRICTEEYAILPADALAFKGKIPQIKGLEPYSPFDYCIAKKLFIHNMGHAMTAYLGFLEGCEYISDAIARPQIREPVRAAMSESARALAKKYNIPPVEQDLHIGELLDRFANPHLYDTVRRVGGDLRRKLGPSDRLVGALNLCHEQGIEAEYICLGIAAAMHFSPDPAAALGAERILAEICRLDSGMPYYKKILQWHEQIKPVSGLS